MALVDETEVIGNEVVSESPVMLEECTEEELHRLQSAASEFLAKTVETKEEELLRLQSAASMFLASKGVFIPVAANSSINEKIPTDWTSILDPDSQEYYFYNTKTGESA